MDLSILGLILCCNKSFVTSEAFVTSITKSTNTISYINPLSKLYNSIIYNIYFEDVNLISFIVTGIFTDICGSGIIISVLWNDLMFLLQVTLNCDQRPIFGSDLSMYLITLCKNTSEKTIEDHSQNSASGHNWWSLFSLAVET